jgi:poly-beta-hydroxyalkanoate depolymerase
MPRHKVEPRWKKGESGNPKGRPKKPVLQMKVAGYTLHEINDTIQAMCSMTLDQLREIWENPNTTLLERTIAASLRKSIEKGNLDSLETLMNRVYGKPNEKLDITTAGDKLEQNKIQVEIITTQKKEGNKTD